MGGKRILAGAAVAVALVAGAGCGSSGDDAGEKVKDQLEELGVEGVDVDGEKVKVSTPEGDVTYETDEDGNLKVTGEDGESTFESGTDAELPADWPEDFELPEGAELTSANTATNDGEKTMTVLGDLSGDPKDVYEGVKDQLTDAGYEIVNDTFMDSTDGAYASLQARSDELEVSATVTGGADGEKGSFIFTVSPTAAE